MIDSFQQLFDMTAPDFTPLYARLLGLDELSAKAVKKQDIFFSD